MIESASAAALTKSSNVPGLIISTLAWDHDKYIGYFYDVAKHSIVRLLWGLAIELRQHRIATVALAPGFMRTERVMSHANGEADWTKIPWLKKSESPEYLGRAVAALASDARLMRRSGKAFHIGELAREYGFTDTDGRRVPGGIVSVGSPAGLANLLNRLGTGSSLLVDSLGYRQAFPKLRLRRLSPLVFTRMRRSTANTDRT